MPDVVHPLAMSWVLRLLPATIEQGKSADVAKRVVGLTLPLRMALSAQAGGAEKIVLAQGTESCRALLDDARLRAAVIGDSELAAQAAPALIVEAPCNLVLHRDLLKDLAQSGARGTRNLVAEPFPFQRPFSFDPILVTDRRSASRAARALLHSLRKPQDGWTSTHLNRHISLFLTRWLSYLPLHPNHVSVGILAVGVLGAYLASRGTYGPMLLGALLFQAQSVLDGCDGELSRVTYRGSHLGEWLDTVGDDLTNYGFFAGAAWGLHAATGSKLYLVAGVVTLACGVATSAIEYRYLAKIGSGDLLKYPLGIGKAPSSSDAPKGKVARLVDGISPLFKRDTFVLLTLLGAAVGLLGPFLVIFAAGGIGILVAVVQAELRMARERGAQAAKG